MVNKFIVLVLQIVYTLLIVIYTSILCLLKQLVPYRYRCKSVYGEIVLVTGAGSGIGRLMAKRFAKLGAKLVLVDIDEKANENTASEISMQGGTVYTFTCDLSKRDEIYRVADEVSICFIYLIYNKKILYLIHTLNIIRYFICNKDLFFNVSLKFYGYKDN